MSTAVRVFRVAVAWLALCGAAHADFPVWTKQLIAVPPSATGITYYVATNGADTNNGTSPSTPFRTIHKAVSLVAAGDTVLIKGGLYREGIDLSVTGVTGTALAPITFGSYGDGEVIVDGSKQVTGWTRVSGTPAIWQATLTFTPVGIVVNEVPLRQVPQSPSTAPKPGVAGVVDGSGKWFWNATTKIVTADFSTTLGPGGDPNSADIVVPNNNGSQQHVFWFDSHYITFKGLTIRGSGSNGAWGYGSHVTVDNCDIKFNGKAAVAFLSSAGPPAIPNWDNAVLMSHAYHNVLVNWPRGNNGFAEAGGGWPGTIVWDTNLRPLARGNVVHMNGGEGIISYGTVAGLSSGSALFEQNIAYDNWSVNLYFDNQPNDIARNNFLFRHPPDPNDFLYVSNTGTYSTLDKFSVCLMLADEQNSSDSTNNFANLDGSQVVNNILAGCRIGIRDYSEGTSAIAHHGLKNTVIMNNTIIMPFNTYTTETYGIYLQDNGANDASSVIGNNIVYGFNNDALFASEKNGAIAGITIDYNDYFSASLTPFQAGLTTVVRLAFAQWKLSITGVDVHSLFADPLFLDVTGFRAAGTTPYDWRLARPAVASPAKGAGTAAGAPANDFSLAARPAPSPTIGALEPSTAGTAFRAYVSGSGSDANPCTLSRPCRLIPAALAVVANGGEIWMLDSANYNTATLAIGKSVSILAVPGQVGSLVAIDGGPAVSITLPGLTVALRNVVVTGFVGAGRTGTTGIEMTGDSELSVEDSAIVNLPQHGIGVTGSGKVKVTDTLFRGMGGYAVRLANGATGEIASSKFLYNSSAILSVGSTTSTTSVSLSDSVISGGSDGVHAISQAAGAVAKGYVTRCTISGTIDALRSEAPGGGSAILVVGSSTVTNNFHGWYNTATIQSLGNNMIADNSGNSGPLTPLSPQ